MLDFSDPSRIFYVYGPDMGELITKNENRHIILATSPKIFRVTGPVNLVLETRILGPLLDNISGVY